MEGAVMFARSTTIMGEPEKLEAGIAYVRDQVMPAITAMDGCVGLSMLADAESGQCIVTSSWTTQDAMRSSDMHLAPMRMRGGQIMGGDPQVEEWEVDIMRRDHRSLGGACCRVTWMRLNHADVDRNLELYRSTFLPEIEALEGFCSTSLMVNRELGRACSTTTYDSRAAMESSRERAWAIRNAGIRDAGVDVLDVAEYNLVLAHLRVPELV
jgi:hypothetical protein